MCRADGIIGYSDDLTAEEAYGKGNVMRLCSVCGRRGPLIKLNKKQLCPSHFKEEIDKGKPNDK